MLWFDRLQRYALLEAWSCIACSSQPGITQLIGLPEAMPPHGLLPCGGARFGDRCAPGVRGVDCSRKVTLSICHDARGVRQARSSIAVGGPLVALLMTLKLNGGVASTTGLPSTLMISIKRLKTHRAYGRFLVRRIRIERGWQ